MLEVDYNKTMKTIMKNKRGQVLNLVSGTVIGFMVLIFVIFAVLYGISALNPSGFFVANSANANATSYLTGNLTSGIGTFAGQIPIVFTILGVVLALSGIVLLIVFVMKMRGTGGNGGGGL